MRELFKKVPGAVPLVRQLRRLGQPPPDRFGSSEYWERRYAAGGNSGPGSYKRLARFKAQFLNTFLAQHQIRSVIELGCGDGAQLALIRYPAYIGVDVSQTIIERTAARFAADRTKRFLLVHQLAEEERADATVSLDVIYHLVEDAVFECHMTALFDRADRFVVIYSANVDAPWDGGHVRYRAFTKWIAANRPNFELVATEKNPFPEDPDDLEHTSIADFYVYRRR